ncbi:MAG: hypothetical protein JST04_14290 [Bdellovibrionales bacterium]|nr:hypothetical protein [Bdellovibrionales bacterium]
MTPIALLMTMQALGAAPHSGSPSYYFGNDHVFFDFDNYHERDVRHEPRNFWRAMRVKPHVVRPDDDSPFEVKSIDFVGGSHISLDCFRDGLRGAIRFCDFYATDNGGTERVYPGEGRIEFVYTGKTAKALNADFVPNAGANHFRWISTDHRTKIDSTPDRFEFTILPEGRTFPATEFGKTSAWPGKSRN